MPLNIERHYDDVITAKSIVAFDKIIYNHYDSQYGGGVGYTLMDDGVIHIHKPGDFVIKWSSTQMTGLSTNREYFSILKRVVDSPSGVYPEVYRWINLHDDELLPTTPQIPANAMSEAITIEDTTEYKIWDMVNPAPGVGWTPLISPAYNEFGEDIAILENGQWWLIDELGHKIPNPLHDEMGQPMLDKDGEEIPMSLLTVALFNVTDQNVKLTPHNHLKVAMMIFNVPPLEREGIAEAEVIKNICDDMDDYELDYSLNDLNVRIEQLDALRIWQDSELSDLLLKSQKLRIDFDDYFKQPKFQPFSSTTFKGLSVCYIQGGNAYNFWCGGTLIEPPEKTSNRKKMLMTSDICTALKLYLGDPCVSPCYCVTSTRGNFWTPVYFDNTGVFFITDEEDFFNDLITLKFTRALILA